MIPKATLEAIEKAKKVLEDVPRGAEDALRLSFNRALITGRKVGANAVSKNARIQSGFKKDIKKTFKLHRATRKELMAELVSEGVRLPLHVYAHTPKQDTTGNRIKPRKKKPVRVQIRRDSEKYPIERGFIYKKRIFQRLGKSRLPVQLQFGPAVPQLIDNARDRQAVFDAMADTVEKRLEHETKRLLDKHNTKKG